MIYLNCDYTEGCHPAILKRLEETNMEQTIGYGMDDYCRNAANLIKNECQSPEADVHFLVGGTQTNVTVIDACIKSYQGVICAKSGHINVHETGAVEACGHKCLALPSKNGKITAEQVKGYVEEHFRNGGNEHMVQPKMVYISNPTEFGTIYIKQELQDLYRICKQSQIYLFLDGARLGYGLMCKENDLTLADIAANTDVFYIGGTKVGALFGEAVVFTNRTLSQDFRYSIKQHGGMLAKGRLLGIQFETLFSDGLYYEISRHALELADQIHEKLKQLQVPFYVDSPTNQIFVVLSDDVLEKLKEKYVLSEESIYDESHKVVRICTSWATKQEYVDTFIKDLESTLS